MSSKVSMCVLSRIWLCNPLDCSPPGSSVHGIFQARMLEWVAISSSRWSSQLRSQSCVYCIAGRFFTNWAISKNSQKSNYTLEGRDCDGEGMYSSFCTEKIFLGKFHACYSISCEQFSLEHLGVGVGRQHSSFNHSFIKLNTNWFIQQIFTKCLYSFVLGSDENNEIEKMIFVLGDLRILDKREKLR